MAEVIRMPKMSDTMKEGVIASWLVKVGDEVSSGDIIAEVETDKATMELENYEDGVLLHIAIQEKESVPIDGIIAIVGEEGEDFQALLDGGATPAESAPAQEEAAAPVAETTSAPVEEIDTSGINASVITMPKMSDTMKEGVIANWLVKVGDEVSSGDIIAEVETDKATMELENYEDGKILYIAVEAGKGVAIDGVIAIVGEEGADYQKLIDAHNAKQAAGSAAAPQKEEAAAPAAPAPAPKKEAPKKAAPAPAAAAPSGERPSASDVFGQRIKVSPLAKKLAEEKGFNLAQIPGTGDHGRIIKRDVEAFVPAPTQAAAPAPAAAAPLGVESFEDIEMNSMRKAITRNLNASQFGAPHFYLTMDINMEKAMAARKSINEIAAPVKISFNDMVVKAVAAALKQHPMVNSQVVDETIKVASHVNVGVAVAIPDGLVVPVIKNTDLLPLSAISAAVKDLAGRAKDKKLGMDEMQGATFTISNLGMFGIEQFTSILNAPASCILAVGGIKQVPVVKDGQIVPGNIMKITLTCDHRSVDGAIGAAFLQTLKTLLEDPVRILV